MNSEFKRFSGGMPLAILGIVAVVILAVYIVTASSSQWVQAAAIIGAAVVAILFIRITGIGRKDTGLSE